MHPGRCNRVRKENADRDWPTFSGGEKDREECPDRDTATPLSSDPFYEFLAVMQQKNSQNFAHLDTLRLFHKCLMGKQLRESAPPGILGNHLRPPLPFV